MRHYRRTDGFEVQDFADRGIDWAKATYGGDFEELESITVLNPTKDDINAASARAAKARKREEFLDALIAGDTQKVETIRAEMTQAKTLTEN